MLSKIQTAFFGDFSHWVRLKTRLSYIKLYIYLKM